MGEMQALLARILKESVQFWYDTSSVRGGGGVRENVPLETFEVYVTSYQYLFHASSFEIFQTHLALRVLNLCRYASLPFSQVYHQIDQNVKCIIIMRIEAILFQIY